MTIPPTEPEIAAMARSMLALDVPAECLAGVAANLALLAEHGRRVDIELAAEVQSVAA